MGLQPDTPYEVNTYFLGTDLGQSTDYTALCVLRETWAIKKLHMSGWHEQLLPDHERRYHITHLERMPLGMPYTEVVRHLRGLVQRIESQVLPGEGSIHAGHLADFTLVLDGTGVGRGVRDILREVGVDVLPVTITSGQDENVDPYGFVRVPKIDLIQGTQVLIQQGRLRVATELHDADTLKQELRAFRYRFTKAANLVFGADQSGQHDDLVIAASLAAWAALRSDDARAEHATAFEIKDWFNTAFAE